MNLFRSIGVVGWAFKSVMTRLFRPALWLPFLLVAGLQFLGLWMLLSFHQTWAQPLMVPLLVKVGGGDLATHYPFFYYVLPVALAWIGLAIGVLVASLTSGAATILFARAFERSDEPRPWSAAARRYPTLLVLTALVSAVIFGIFKLQELVPQDIMLHSQAKRWGIRMGFLGLVILVQSLFIYAVPWVVLRGSGLLASLRQSLVLFRKTAVPTLILVAIPAVLIYPMRFLAGRADLFTTKFQPELMTAVVGTEIVLELVLGFFLVGTLTFLFLWRQEGSR